MERLKKVVEKVDTMLAQVLIESIIMEVSLGDTLSYGVDARQRRKQFTENAAGAGLMNNTGGLNNLLGVTNVLGDGSLNSSGFSYIAQLGQNWDVLITAAATDSRVNIIQRPRILTSHATEGSFFVGSEVPFVNGTTAGGVYGNSSYYQREQVGVGLNVLPYITPDGLVVMEISQEIASLGKPIKIDNNDVPTTQTRNATSTVTVRDKDAILIGGYITSSDTKANSGVPVLKDLPILGMLFRSSSKSHDRTEMMVLMRPTILKTPLDAAKMADQERQRLPGVRVAEKTSEDYEQLEQMKADAEVMRLDQEQQKRVERANKKAKNGSKNSPPAPVPNPPILEPPAPERPPTDQTPPDKSQPPPDQQ
jgi:general secretion pathway protein D